MNALVIFAKYPTPGEVKTRIGKVIGMEKSAKLCEYFIKDLYSKHNDMDYDLYLSFIGPEHKEDYRKMFPGAILYVQRGKDMGENLFLTFEDLLDDYEKVILIGSDTPQVGPKIVKASIKALESYDVVIGPARDGGFYLIGTKKCYSFIEKLPWDQPNLLDYTLSKLKEKNLSHVLLEGLDDIDNIDELKLAKKNLKKDDAPLTYGFIHKIDL